MLASPGGSGRQHSQGDDALLCAHPQGSRQHCQEKERRKRRPAPLRVAGFCLPKALQPILPIFLQGILQVRLPTCQEHSQLSCFGLLPATPLQKALRPEFADPPTRASPGMAVQEYKPVVPVVPMLPAGDMLLAATPVFTSCLL